MKSALFVFLVATAGLQVHAQNGTVVLNVEGIDSKKGGLLSAAIFTRSGFPKAGNHVKGMVASVAGDTMQLTITDIPAGVYGAAVFQDVDMNQKLKTNFIGIPVEPMGFSNNARIRFGPPSFEDARFVVESGKQVVLDITLR